MGVKFTYFTPASSIICFVEVLAINIQPSTAKRNIFVTADCWVFYVSESYDRWTCEVAIEESEKERMKVLSFRAVAKPRIFPQTSFPRNFGDKINKSFSWDLHSLWLALWLLR